MKICSYWYDEMTINIFSNKSAWLRKLKYSSRSLWRLSKSLLLWWVQSIQNILNNIIMTHFKNIFYLSRTKIKSNMVSYLSIFFMINYWWFQNFDRIEEKEYFRYHFFKKISFRRILIISRYLQTKILSSSPSIFVIQFFFVRIHSFVKKWIPINFKMICFFCQKTWKKI